MKLMGLHAFAGVPATEACRCGLKYEDSVHVKVCPCPRGWRMTPPDLTAAGNRGTSSKLWVRLDTDPACTVHDD